jgi:biopolymer transport protein ExbD
MAVSTNNTDGGMLSEMNTTPLIDVMLVLLTLLIITLPMQTHAVKLDVPKDHSPLTPPPVVALRVDFDGAILWNGRAVDHATLDRDLAAAAALNLQPDIHIEADRLARYDAVAYVLADVQRHGLTKMGFTNLGEQG